MWSGSGRESVLGESERRKRGENIIRGNLGSVLPFIHLTVPYTSSSLA